MSGHAFCVALHTYSVETSRFDALGWFQFEKLCQAILVATYGGSVESWGGSGDLGRDAYCPADIEWRGESAPGPVVVQAKFVQNANANGAKPLASLKRAARAEMDRVRDRVERGLIETPKSYLLFTNAPVEPKNRGALIDLMSQAIPGAFVKLVTGDDLATWLADLTGVRQSFPQLLGLEDFELLIARATLNGIEAKTKAALKEAHDLARCNVETNFYGQATESLKTHYYTVLSGPPEVGKTATAHVLALEAAAEGFDIVFCRKPETFYATHFNPNPQLYIVDDAFGSNQYDASLADDWGRELHYVIPELGPTRKIIFTSRSTPLKMALEQMHLQSGAQTFGQKGLIVFDMAKLSDADRGRMVYVHAKSVNNGDRFKQVLMENLNRIVNSSEFTPLRVKNLIAAISKPSPYENEDLNFTLGYKSVFEEPSESMRKALDNLDEVRRRYLYASLDTHGSWKQEEVDQAFRRIFPESEEVDVKTLGDSLLDHFIRPDFWSAGSEDRRTWVHPTWRDLLVNYLAERSGPRVQFLSGCGLHGVRMALGIASGWNQRGSQTMIRETSDLEVLRANIERLGESAIEQNDLWLSLLLDFNQYLERDWPEGLPKIGPMTDLSLQILMSAESGYEHNLNPYEPAMTNAAISAFLQIAARTPRDFKLEVNRAWRERCEWLWFHSPLKSDIGGLASAFHNWLELIWICRGNEDRLWDSIEPALYVKDARRTLRRLIRALKSTLNPVEGMNDVTSIQDCVNLCQQLYPDLGLYGDFEKAKLTSEVWAEAIIEEEKWDRMFQMEEELEEANGQGNGQPMESHQCPDLASIFSDL